MKAQGAPEELHYGGFGGFAYARVGVFEVGNEMGHVSAEGQVLGLVHLQAR